MSITKLGDDLMKVPKLDVSGTNWVVYKNCFLWVIDARDLLDHVNGSGWEPTKPVSKGKKVGGGSKEGEASREDFVVVEELSPEDAKTLEVWKEKHCAWRHSEAVVKQQVAATIPNSLFMKVQGKGTTYEIWQALTKDFQNKSRMISMDLRRRLQQQHCAEKGNVRAHFATLRTMREDLSSMGHPPTDDDFYAILLGSLPSGYEPFISALNTMSSVLGMYLSSDDLMQTLSDEYDCRNISKTSKREENSAFHAGEVARRAKPF